MSNPEIPENLDQLNQVKSLLFGKEIKRNDEKFDALRDEIRKSQERMQEQVKFQLASLQKALDDQSSEFNRVIDTQEKRVHDGDKTIQEKMADVREALQAQNETNLTRYEKLYTEFKDQVKKSFGTLHHQMRVEIEKLKHRLDATVISQEKLASSLREECVSRQQLADLLTDLADRFRVKNEQEPESENNTEPQNVAG